MNNSRVPWTKDAKFSEYYFYLNTNIYGDFQIGISITLNSSDFASFRLRNLWLRNIFIIKKCSKSTGDEITQIYLNNF